MHIGLFLTYGYSLKDWESQGVLKREIALIEYLINNFGYKFTIFSYGKEFDLEVIHNENIKVVPLYKKIYFTSNKFIDYINSFLIPFKLRKEFRNIDIIQQHQLLGCWVSLLSKFIYKKPIYMRTGYDMYYFSVMNKKAFYKKALLKLLTNFALRYSDIYTVTSKSDQIFLNNLFKKNYITKLRPNWAKSSSDKNTLRSNKILCVGRLEKQKNFELIIKEFKKSDTIFEVDLYGSGEYEDQLKNASKDKRFKINFLGNLTHEELQEVYKNYKIFLTSSLFEGNPKTLLEAMGAGCVVIASDIPHHRELINDHKDGILFNLKNPQLVKLLETMLKNENKFNELSKNAIKKIKNNNSIDILAKLTNQDYQSLLITDK